jgi:hypothetical protein
LNGTGIYTVSSVYPTPLSVHGLTITDPGANLLVGSEVVVTNTLLVSAGTLSIANGDLFLGAKVLENDGVIYSDNLGASTTKVVPSQFINNGSIYINGDTIDISPAPSTNSGIIRVENNGLFQVGEGLSGTGSVELDSGGTVDYGFPSGVSQIGTVDFLDGAGDVYVDETYITLGSTPAAIVQNFQPGDTIDLTGLDPTLNTDLQVGVSGGSIDVMSNSTLLEAIPEVGLPNSATLSIGPDSGCQRNTHSHHSRRSRR